MPLTLKKIPVAPKPKDKKGCDVPCGIDDSNRLPYSFPSFSVSEKQMPEVGTWEPEKKYRLVMDIVMTSKESRRHSATHGGFDILAYKVLPGAKPVGEMNRKELGEYAGKQFAKHGG